MGILWYWNKKTPETVLDILQPVKIKSRQTSKQDDFQPKLLQPKE